MAGMTQIAGERFRKGDLIELRADGRAYRWGGKSPAIGVAPRDMAEGERFEPLTGPAGGTFRIAGESWITEPLPITAGSDAVAAAILKACGIADEPGAEQSESWRDRPPLL